MGFTAETCRSHSNAVFASHDTDGHVGYRCSPTEFEAKLHRNPFDNKYQNTLNLKKVYWEEGTERPTPPTPRTHAHARKQYGWATPVALMPNGGLN